MAINKVVRNSIGDGEIKSSNIEDGAITSGKISDATTISISKTPIGALPPTISSLDTTQINPSSGATVTITGTRFVSIPNVVFLNTSTGARINASTIGFTSSTTITAAFPSGQTAGTYKVQVENPDGQGVLSTASIIYSIAPTWSTAANLGSVEEGESVNISLVAYDDDSTAVTSYTLVSGSLPSGVTLSGDSTIGTLTGTAPTVSADTAYTFTIRATDDESQTSDREFTLTITNWTVANSLRFNDGSSDSLNRTFGTPSNNKIHTTSVWFKRSSGLGVNQSITYVEQGGGYARILLHNSDAIFIDGADSSAGNSYGLTTNRLFRDVSAWYHIVVAFDDTQGTAANRLKIYVNGVQETSFSSETYPTQNIDYPYNSANAHYIGRNTAGATYYDGYLAEYCFIDGTQNAVTDFGEFDEDSGIWKPKSVSGLTFGTNGFYLPFTNSGSLGADSSGNSNDFTVNNLTAIDQTTDTPTNNFAVLQPNLGPRYSTQTFSDGNLSVSGGAGFEFHPATIGVSSGKWYFEAKLTSKTSYPGVGIIASHQFETNNQDAQSNSQGYVWHFNGQFNNGGSVVYTGNAINANDICMIAFDATNGVLWFGKNGTWENSATQSEIEAGTTTNAIWSDVTNAGIDSYNFLVQNYDSAWSANFGNPPFTISSGNSDANGYGNFEYAVPSGYFALNTKNLAEYG